MTRHRRSSLYGRGMANFDECIQKKSHKTLRSCVVALCFDSTTLTEIAVYFNKVLRFRQPKFDWKMIIFVNAAKKSTSYKTKWSSGKVFEEWKQSRLVKSCTLEGGGFFTTKDLKEYKL